MMEAIVGFITGAIASMGLGGGFVLVIWLTIFADVGQKAAQGINLLFFLPIALVSLIVHIRGGLVDKSLLKKYIPGGVIGAILGTLASDIIPSELLRKLFALFLLALGLRELFTAKKATSHDEEKPWERTE